MTQLGFFIDMSRCTGCKTCQVACKDKNNLEVGRNFRRVSEYAGGTWTEMHGAWQQDVFAYYVSIACNHCEQPACIEACPKDAYTKRADDGLVIVDSTKCIGCHACEEACPYGAPQYSKTTHKITKCDGCLDRLATGAQPTCVDACPQRAIEFGDIIELRRQHGTLADVAPLADVGLTRPNLIIKAPRKARPVGDRQGSLWPMPEED